MVTRFDCTTGENAARNDSEDAFVFCDDNFFHLTTKLSGL